MGRLLIAGAAALLAAAPAAAQEESASLPGWLALHGQATAVVQATPGFRSPMPVPTA